MKSIFKEKKPQAMKIRYSAFRQQNLHRFRVKYPFLNKSQINLKVRQLWMNLFKKKYSEENKGLYNKVFYYVEL